MKKMIIASLGIFSFLLGQVQTFELKKLPTKQIQPVLSRGMISGNQGTIGYFTYKKGAIVPEHSHSNEQYSLITQGSVKVWVEGEEYIVKAGEGIIIPPNLKHSFMALEDNTIDIDFFSPQRTDWIYEADNYYNPIPAEKIKPEWNKKPFSAEVFAHVEQAVGNIAFTHKGELVYSHHPFFNPTINVVQYNAQTKKTTPFPNEKWNTPRQTDDLYLSTVLGIRNDQNGVIWMLDMGQRHNITPKIVGWNTLSNQLEAIYYLPNGTVNTNAQPNDMVVDTKNGVFIIADEGIGAGGDGKTAALIVVDMKTHRTRRLLEGHSSTKPEEKPILIDQKPLLINQKPILVGCDGITADKNFEWLYYAPLNGSKIYRIKIAAILDETLTSDQLSAQVESYSDKPNNGGLSIDSEGNLYLTAIETNSIAVILAKDRSVHTLMQDKKLLWPDGVSYNHSDGYMYVSAAQVHLGAVFNGGKNLAKAPFYIFRFEPLAKGVPFR